MKNDLIFREMVRKIICIQCDIGDKDGHSCNDECQVMDSIDSVPAVDVEVVRHGQWIEKTSVPGDKFITGCTYYECNVCGRVEEENSAPYCHCGAKMDGGKGDA